MRKFARMGIAGIHGEALGRMRAENHAEIQAGDIFALPKIAHGFQCKLAAIDKVHHREQDDGKPGARGSAVRLQIHQAAAVIPHDRFVRKCLLKEVKVVFASLPIREKAKQEIEEVGSMGDGNRKRGIPAAISSFEPIPFGSILDIIDIPAKDCEFGGWAMPIDLEGLHFGIGAVLAMVVNLPIGSEAGLYAV